MFILKLPAKPDFAATARQMEPSRIKRTHVLGWPVRHREAPKRNGYEDRSIGTDVEATKPSCQKSRGAPDLYEAPPKPVGGHVPIAET